MKQQTIASILLMALPVVTIAAGQAAQPSAGAAIDQSHPGSTMSVSENASGKHLAAAAAHEQTAVHHKAAANAYTEQERRQHAKEAENASLEAGKKSNEAFQSTMGNK